MKRYIKSSMDIEYDSDGNVVPAEIANALKNSKVRNRKGQLLVCYHGTPSEFNEFKKEIITWNLLK